MVANIEYMRNGTLLYKGISFIGYVGMYNGVKPVNIIISNISRFGSLHKVVHFAIVLPKERVELDIERAISGQRRLCWTHRVGPAPQHQPDLGYSVAASAIRDGGHRLRDCS